MGIGRRGFLGSIVGFLLFLFGKGNRDVLERGQDCGVIKVPLEFEDVIINTPVLYGELQPILSEGERRKLIEAVKRSWCGYENDGPPEVVDGLIERIQEKCFVDGLFPPIIINGKKI